MSRQEKYVKIERERIAELVEKIEDLKILGLIYKFIARIIK